MVIVHTSLPPPALVQLVPSVPTWSSQPPKEVPQRSLVLGLFLIDRPHPPPMGRNKKSFIDKRNSTTFTLTWGGGGRASDDEEGSVAPDAVSIQGSQAARGQSQRNGAASEYGSVYDSDWG